MPHQFYTFDEVAERIRTHRRTLERLVAAGRGPVVTRLCGRPLIREDHLAEWLDSAAGRQLPESDGRRRHAA